MDEFVKVRVAVIEKDGKIDYVYEEGEIAYYESHGWRVIDHEDMYI